MTKKGSTLILIMVAVVAIVGTFMILRESEVTGAHSWRAAHLQDAENTQIHAVFCQGYCADAETGERTSRIKIASLYRNPVFRCGGCEGEENLNERCEQRLASRCR